MNLDPLYEAVLGAIVFLELSGPEVVDQDAGVATLEQIAQQLQQLGAEERASFLRYVSERAKKAEHQHERELLQDLPGALGLV